MNGGRRGLWAGATFLMGFAAALWLSSDALGNLRGPRAGLMRELNRLRVGANVAALRPDGSLGRAAQQHAAELARESVLARALQPSDLERSARGQGWRGTGPLRVAQLRGPDAAGSLRDAFASGTLADPDVRRVGVGLALASDGSSIAVVLLAR